MVKFIIVARRVSHAVISALNMQLILSYDDPCTCTVLTLFSFPYHIISLSYVSNQMAASKHIAHSLLLNAHPPDTASAIFKEKVLHKPLHLRPTSPDINSRDARAQRRLHRLRKKEKSQRCQKPKPFSAKEKRMSGIYDIPENGQKYDVYVPLHRMWLGYMWEILGMNEGKEAYVMAQSAGSKLASADYHGAEVTVVRSRCMGLVGLAGIIVRDTKFTFQIITKKNLLKSMFFLFSTTTDIIYSVARLTWRLVVPKKHTVFRFEIVQPGPSENGFRLEGRSRQEADPNHSLQNLIFELHGTQFENRATDRATKKFKQKNLVDL